MTDDEIEAEFERLPCPQAPGVDAMLRDGWVWTWFRFERDIKPDFGGPLTVIVETEVSDLDAPVYCRVGVFRTDNAFGESVLAPFRWASRSWWSGAFGEDLLAMIVSTEARRPGRYATSISERRVYAERYAERLPTNRQRKRQRAKLARAARKRSVERV